MKKLNYSVNINAPVRTFWAMMLDDARPGGNPNDLAPALFT
ncbi:hypothetical protein [Arthrobacter sp. ISL-28]|nr:hypothetical protein [Arthrobacter sp. ISL-28]